MQRETCPRRGVVLPSLSPELSAAGPEVMMPGMKEPPAESPVPADPVQRSDSGSGRGRSLGEFLWAIYDPHLQSLKEPLPWLERFAVALAGSVWLFGVYFWNQIRVQQLAPGREVPLFADPAYGMPVLAVFAAVLCCLFAGLVSALPSRSGHVRLFLAGLLLPALSVKVAELTWG